MKIVLIGFMGAGKTTLGKMLSRNLGYEYIDMDQMIIKKSGRKSDREIFDKDGEEKFRKLETEAAKDLKHMNDCVISTGGGIIMNIININYLCTNGTIVFLKNSFETSVARINPKNPPPLFRDKIKARKLFDQRQPLYEKYSNLIINTDRKSLDEVLKEILLKLNI